MIYYVVCHHLMNSKAASKLQYTQALLAVRTKRLESIICATEGIFQK